MRSGTHLQYLRVVSSPSCASTTCVWLWAAGKNTGQTHSRSVWELLPWLLSWSRPRARSLIIPSGIQWSWSEEEENIFVVKERKGEKSVCSLIDDCELSRVCGQRSLSHTECRTWLFCLYEATCRPLRFIFSASCTHSLRWECDLLFIPFLNVSTTWWPCVLQQDYANKWKLFVLW